MKKEDEYVVDAIATYLGTWSEWSGADALEAIADLIGRVRPHPGNVPAEIYAQAFANYTDRRIDPNYDMTGR